MMDKVFIVCLMLMSPWLYGQTVKVVTEEVPPMQIVNDDGMVSGTNIERVKKIFAAANLRVEFEVLPWPRAVEQALTNKNTFIMSIARTPERESQYHWITILEQLEPNITVLKTRDDIEATNIEELRKYRVAVSRGDFGEDYLKNNGFTVNKNLYLTIKHTYMWKQLMSGRVDAVFTNNVTAESELLSAGGYLGLVKPLFTINSIAKDVYLAANIDTEQALIEQVRQAALQLNQKKPN